MSNSPRYVVRDALHGQNMDLIARGDRRLRERWQVVDTTITNGDPIIDEYASKRAAMMHVRDLNQEA